MLDWCTSWRWTIRRQHSVNVTTIGPIPHPVAVAKPDWPLFMVLLAPPKILFLVAYICLQEPNPFQSLEAVVLEKSLQLASNICNSKRTHHYHSSTLKIPSKSSSSPHFSRCFPNFPVFPPFFSHFSPTCPIFPYFSHRFPGVSIANLGVATRRCWKSWRSSWAPRAGRLRSWSSRTWRAICGWPSRP